MEALYLKEGKETTKLAKFELKLKPYVDLDPECWSEAGTGSLI